MINTGSDQDNLLQNNRCPVITEQDDFDFLMMGGLVTRNQVLPVIDSLIHVTPSFIINSAPYLKHRDHKQYFQDK